MFTRTCQECGHKQPAKDPATYKDQTKEAWRDVKCTKCGSAALDYGNDPDLSSDWLDGTSSTSPTQSDS